MTSSCHQNINSMYENSEKLCLYLTSKYVLECMYKYMHYKDTCSSSS